MKRSRSDQIEVKIVKKKNESTKKYEYFHRDKRELNENSR